MQMYNAFPTPVGFFDVENSKPINEGLTNFLYSIKEEDGPQRSMVGGYHSKDDLLSRNNTFIQQFHKIISEQIKEYHSKVSKVQMGPNTRMVSWCMIYPAGARSEPHLHSGADYSSAYYCKVPKLSNGEGNFVGVDPRQVARWDNNFRGQCHMNVTAKEGQGIIFPGWLDHYVTPHKSDEDRICITTNIFIDQGTFTR